MIKGFTPAYLPPSANGQCLIAMRPLASWYIVAAWPAPAFTLDFDQCDDERAIEPMLYHGEDSEHFLSFGLRLHSDFTEVSQ